jgi:2-polyprenyl-3-methyl-5-hydroxy-6-metoxy-1,4-benzoquinol methylase
VIQQRSCPICKSSEYSSLFAEENIDRTILNEYAYASRKLPEYMHFRLLLCMKCDLVYVATDQDPGELFTAYTDAAFDSAAESSAAAKTYCQVLEPLIVNMKEKKGVLDIGAGDGAFLSRMLDAGFSDVVGVEPSKAPIDSAPHGIQKLIYNGFFERNVFSADSYSLVTCFQTIEHVLDPLELVRASYDVLRTGGFLCIVGHNRRSFSSKVLGRRSPIFDIEHLQLFSKKSMTELFNKGGFTQVDVRGFYNTYSLSYWAKLFPFPRFIKRVMLKGLDSSRLGQLSITLPAGNIIAIGQKV